MNTSPSRRDFLRCTCASASLLALGWSLTGCDSDVMEDDPPVEGDGVTIDGNTITLNLGGSRAMALASAGGFLLIDAAKTVAINTGDQIRAFTSVCTHRQCDINGFQNSLLICPCHNSQFNTAGEVVSGPAPSALTEFAVVRDGDVVTITKA